MPTFSITISTEAAARLKAVVDRYNENTGSSLTVAQWIVLHLKELALADDLAAAHERIRKQAEDDATAAFLAERRRLLDSL